MKIQFQINYKKTLQCILWIINKKQKIHLYYIEKILFQADHLSVNKYGVPVTGDTYFAKQYGTVPNFAGELLHQDPITLDLLNISAFPFTLKGSELETNQQADEDYLSETDKECLTIGFEAYAHLTHEEVTKKNHELKAWQDTYSNNLNGPIDWYDMIDNENIKQDLVETAAYLVI